MSLTEHLPLLQTKYTTAFDLDLADCKTADCQKKESVMVDVLWCIGEEE
jgi:hypothetical protein